MALFQKSYQGANLNIEHRKDDQFLPSITFKDSDGNPYAATGLSDIVLKFYDGESRVTTLATITEANGISYDAATGKMTFTIGWASINLDTGEYYYDIAWTTPNKRTGAYGIYKVI